MDIDFCLCIKTSWLWFTKIKYEILGARPRAKLNLLRLPARSSFFNKNNCGLNKPKPDKFQTSQKDVFGFEFACFQSNGVVNFIFQIWVNLPFFYSHCWFMQKNWKLSTVESKMCRTLENMLFTFVWIKFSMLPWGDKKKDQKFLKISQRLFIVQRRFFF